MDLLWNYLVELRKEIVESQKLRAQIIGFKITFVSAAIGLIGTNIDKIPSALLAVPAFASIFFDFLINSYSYSIRCLGFYIRNEIEPKLKNLQNSQENLILWEEFLKQKAVKPKFAYVGNLGLTFLAVFAAIVALFIPFNLFLSSILILILLLLFVLDLIVYLKPFQLKK